MIKVVRYVIPSSEKEANIEVQGDVLSANYSKVADSDLGNIELFLEHNDDKPTHRLIIRAFETGEVIPSYAYYLFTVNTFNRLPLHLYVVWSSEWNDETEKDDGEGE